MKKRQLENVLVLKFACRDQVGLLYKISEFIAKRNGSLLEVEQFTDPITHWFFAHFVIDAKNMAGNGKRFIKDFGPLAKKLNAEWSLRRADEKKRVAILVSKEDHCLMDLLWRWQSQELHMDLPFVFSNHERCRSITERAGVPFFYFDFSGENKLHAFKRFEEICVEHGINLIVLARFMQIIPPHLCKKYFGKIINIHHSFLPAFVGANPYRRAFERGVKLIGATCHYVTEELDAGPIIEQEVVRVEHYHTPDDLVRLGRDCERLALARGVRYHLEDRILIHHNKAVVFRD